MQHLIATKPLDIIAIDFTVLEMSQSGIENVLVMTDVFSKLTLAVPTKDQTARTVAKVIVKEWINKLGVPQRIHSDRGKSFDNKVMKELSSLYGIRQSKTTPYHPIGNSQCERYNRTLHDLLKTLEKDKKVNWPNYIQELTAIYNCTPHSSTGFTPYQLYFGRQPRLPIDNFIPTDNQPSTNVPIDEWVRRQQEKMETVERIAKKAKQRKAKHDRKGKFDDLEIGNKVLVRNRCKGRNKIQDHWISTPYIVIGRVTGNSSAYIVQNTENEKVKTSNRIDLLRFVHDSESDSDSSTSSDDKSSSSDEEVITVTTKPRKISTKSPTAVRRSSRSNLGKHSNPHHLAVSTIKDYSQSVLQLGKIIGHTFEHE